MISLLPIYLMVSHKYLAENMPTQIGGSLKLQFRGLNARN